MNVEKIFDIDLLNFDGHLGEKIENAIKTDDLTILAEIEDVDLALVMACKSGKLASVRYLVENRKANINYRRNLPIRIAKKFKNINVARYLIEKEYNTLKQNCHKIR